MKNRQAVLELLDRGLVKLGEVKPRDTASANRLREGKEKVRAARAKVAEEPEDDPAPVEPPPPEAPSPIYVGSWIREGRTGSTAPWNGNYWTTFENLSGCKMALIHFGMKWGQFYDETLALCSARGAAPFLDVAPPGSLAELLAGKEDAAIKQMGEEMGRYGKPMLFRPMWEANGDWYSYGRSPDYVNAWRYMHARIAPLAPNVSWVYCPNAPYDTASESALNWMYPGDAFVDWVGFDSYNHGLNPAKPYGWKTVDQVLERAYKALRTLAPNKPILVGETACSEYGGNKAEWIKAVFAALHRYPAIRAFVWFSWEIAEGGGYMDWPPTTSTAATAAWKAALDDPYLHAAPNANATGQKLLVP